MFRRIVFSWSTNNFVTWLIFWRPKRPPPLILACVIVAGWLIEDLLIIMMIITPFFGRSHGLRSEFARRIFIVPPNLYACLLLAGHTLLHYPGVASLRHLLHGFIQRTVWSLGRLFRQFCKTGLTIRGTLLSIRINHWCRWIIRVSLMHD